MSHNPPPTAEMLQQLQQQHRLLNWTLRLCEACGCRIGYVFPGNEPWFDGSCDCRPAELALATWQDVANEYARAPDPRAWGLGPPVAALPSTKRPNLVQVLAELRREQAVRARVYPGWAAEGKNGLTPAVAAHRLACIDEALAALQQLVPEQGTLF